MQVYQEKQGGILALHGGILRGIINQKGWNYGK
jgi:hypothetical protein